LLTGFDLQVYQKGTAGISWLLTPATVCLAIPLYEQLKVLKKHLPAILIGIFAGVFVSLGSILLLCRLFRLEDVMTVSLLPKSITTAIGLVLSEQNGGISALTTFAIIITGILGNLSGVGFRHKRTGDAKAGQYHSCCQQQTDPSYFISGVHCFTSSQIYFFGAYKRLSTIASKLSASIWNS
jgi:hypothetical protein